MREPLAEPLDTVVAPVPGGKRRQRPARAPTHGTCPDDLVQDCVRSPTGGLFEQVQKPCKIQLQSHSSQEEPQ